MTQTTNRFTKFQRVQWQAPTNPESDEMRYKSLGKSFELTIYPTLTAIGVPTVTIQTETTTQAPDKNPVHDAHRCKIEIEGEVFHFYGLSILGGHLKRMAGQRAAEISRLYAAEMQGLGVLVNAAGAVVHTVTGPAEDPFLLLQHTKNDYLYTRYRRKVEMKQIILPVNEEELTHEFQVQFSASGFGRHTFTGPVGELRRRGWLGGTKNYFEEAHVWPIEGTPVLIARNEDFYFVARLTKDGSGYSQRATGYPAALRTAQQIFTNEQMNNEQSN
jgi:hypothetical protein